MHRIAHRRDRCNVILGYGQAAVADRHQTLGVDKVRTEIEICAPNGRRYNGQRDFVA
jgi:hypothetical protein